MMENSKGSLEDAQGQGQSAGAKQAGTDLQRQALISEVDGYIPRESEAPHGQVLVVTKMTMKRLACGRVRTVHRTWWVSESELEQMPINVGRRASALGLRD
jgi:hypothetical protein